MHRAFIRLVSFSALLFCFGTVTARDNDVDKPALIERILDTDRRQAEQIHDVSFDAEYIEGERNDDGVFEEKARFVKKVMLLYTDDTVYFREDYLEYWKEGSRQSEEDLRKEAADRYDRKQRRKGRDLSWPIMSPFYTENQERYEIEYVGMADGLVEERTCYQFRVRAREESDELINGDYYFEVASFHLVRVDFSPARLVKKTMFKLKELNMSIRYRPVTEGFWLPYRTDISGKGKAAFFFGVSFAGTEYYRNPRINTGLSPDMFEVAHD
ncbi:MAG TPA: hypothetical protein PLF13_03325 [candidate division Zixibacteria bacterium]|nr:hypothetical protein [candidate division Zixibacteria bacterium]